MVNGLVTDSPTVLVLKRDELSLEIWYDRDSDRFVLDYPYGNRGKETQLDYGIEEIAEVVNRITLFLA